MQSKIGQPHSVTGKSGDDRGFVAATVWIKPEFQGNYETLERGSNASVDKVLPSRKVVIHIGHGPYHALLREFVPESADHHEKKRCIGRQRGAHTVSTFIPHQGYFEEIEVPSEWLERLDQVVEDRIDYRKWGKVTQEITRLD
jgi:hypothetical protein